MKKNTKIVATIGPATESKEVLAQLIKAGMNIARFNTKHSTPKWHNDRIKRVREVSEELNTPVGVLLDLQGPEVRINLPGEEAFMVEEKEIVTFTSNQESTVNKIAFIPQDVVESMSKGDLVLLDDGSCEFTIVKKGKDYFEAKALHECKVGHRKTMNTPGVILDMPSLTDRDLEYINGIDSELIDYVGLSFVRDANDIKKLKSVLEKRGAKSRIVAKVENQAAIDNLDDIIEVSDAVMIARGDLGVEVAFEQLVKWQHIMIAKCRQATKPVITATQMLKSMVDNPRPTRAEVSDVAHAIYDGTDAVMLSEETTIGEYPVRAVETQAKIAEFNEPLTSEEFVCNRNNDKVSAIVRLIADVVKNESLKIDRVVVLTETGRTARLLSRFRPKIAIDAVTSTELTYRTLSLSYGVKSHILKMIEGADLGVDELVKELKKAEIINKGERIVMVHGKHWKKSGFTNTLSLLDVK
jgi:pyruvate kinase